MSEETIQIEVIIEGGFLHEGIKYSKGDVSTEPKAIGEYFCRAGWAKDTLGIVPTTTPSSTDTILLVQDIQQPNSVETL